MPDYQQIIAA